MSVFRTCLVAVMLVGCAGLVPAPLNFRLPLTEVKRPADVEERWGDYTIQPAENGYTYSDDLFDVLVVAAGGTFLLSLDNKTDHSIQLLWDEMSYVGPDEVASRVVSGETSWATRNNPQTPTTIPTGAKAELTAIPLEHLWWQDSSQYVRGGIRIRDFVVSQAQLDQYAGMDIRLVVPIRVQDTVNEYTFQFELESVGAPSP